jgi:hypothetical protein
MHAATIRLMFFVVFSWFAGLSVAAEMPLVPRSAGNPWPNDRPVPLTVNPYQCLIDTALARYFRPTSAERQDSDRGPGLLVGAVVPDGPGAKAGLRVGDRVVGIYGWWIRNLREFDFLRELVDREPDAIPVVVEREGKLVKLDITKVLPLFRLKCDFKSHWSDYDPDFPKNEVLPIMFQVLERNQVKMGDVPPSLWKGFPETPTWDLVCYLKKQPEAPKTWIVPFATLYLHMVTQNWQQATLAAANPELDRVPLPSWKRLIAFYKQLIAHEGAEHADPEALGVDPIYYILHYPHFHAFQNLGDAKFQDERLTTLVERLFLFDGESDDEAVKLYRDIEKSNDLFDKKKSNDSVFWRIYIISLLESLVNPDTNMTGTVWKDFETPKETIFASYYQDFQVWTKSDKKDPLLALLAEILLAARQEREKDVFVHLNTLAKRSPFLATWATITVKRMVDQANLKKIQTPINTFIMSNQDIPYPSRDAYYQRLREHSELSSATFMPSWRPCISTIRRNDPASLLCFIGPKAFFEKIKAHDWQFFNKDTAWQAEQGAIDPRFTDETGNKNFQSELYQLICRSDWSPPSYRNTMALIYARQGEWEKAERWQAVALDSAERGEEHGSADLNHEQIKRFKSQLEMIRAHTPIVRKSFGTDRQKHEENGLTWETFDGKAYGPITGRDAEGHLLLSGFLLDDRRFGHWQTWDAQGRALTSGEYYNGFPHGLWRHTRPDGTTEALGRLHQCSHKWHRRHVRRDFWRFYHPDGTTVLAEGWFFDHAQAGLWRYWRPDGTLLGAGGMWKGKPVGPWDWRDEAGKPTSPGKLPDIHLPKVLLGNAMADARFPGSQLEPRKSKPTEKPKDPPVAPKPEAPPEPPKKPGETGADNF